MPKKETIEIRPDNDQYESIHRRWLDNGKPRRFTTGNITYTSRTDENGVVFSVSTSSWEQYYGSLST
jgi:hypothetical protein